jgi:hypothetical protein
MEFVMKTIKWFCLISVFLACSINLFAQTNDDETQKVRERAEAFLHTAREKKWDELFKFVVIIKHQNGLVIKQRMDVAENADEETKNQIAERFKNLYTAPKPGKIIGVKLNEKDKMTAQITYKHEDLDGFDMILIDGEWYYTIDYYR